MNRVQELGLGPVVALAAILCGSRCEVLVVVRAGEAECLPRRRGFARECAWSAAGCARSLLFEAGDGAVR